MLPAMTTPPFRAFAPRELAVLSGFARALIPPGGTPAPAGDDIDLAAATDLFFAEADPESLRAFTGMLRLFEWAPWPLSPKLRRFSRLDDAGRAAVVGHWATSRWAWQRAVFLGLKSIVAMAYCSDAGVERALGYDAGCLRGEPSDPPAGDGVTGTGAAPRAEAP